MVLTLTLALALLVLSSLVVHFVGQHRIARAVEQQNQSQQLLCSECGLKVARYKQLADSRIQCANCEYAAWKKLPLWQRKKAG